MTPHSRDCMEAIKELLAEPKPPGQWWAREVVQLYDEGRPVSRAAIELARKALNL